MGVASHLNVVTKQRAKIVTCDPKTRKVEAIGGDGAVVQVAVWEVPNSFRWPKVGEFWLIRRENAYWFLDSPYPVESRIPIEDLEPGDVLIGGGEDTTVHIDADNILVNGELGNDAHFVHKQDLALSEWEIEHNLNKRPSVTIVDSADSVVLGNINYIDDNSLVVSFNAIFSGKAYLN